MATIEQLVSRIETRLFLAAGIDVQTHAEDQIVEMIRHKYNVLFDDHWYTKYTHFAQFDLDGTTGQIVGDISAQVLRYDDIHSVYYDQDETPLPQMSITANPTRVRRRSIAPSDDATKVFKVFPLDDVGPVGIWYRTKLADSVWDDAHYDTQINFDDEMIMLGVVYEFLFNDDSNQMAVAEYKKMFDARVIQMRKNEFIAPLSKSKVERDGPLDRWTCC